MNKHIELETYSLALFSLLLVAAQMPAIFLFKEGAIGIFLYSFLLLIVLVSLFKGTIAGLLWCLPFLFIIGSVLIYSNLPASSLSTNLNVIPLPYFMAYGLSIVILVLIAGKIHERVTRQGEMVHQLKEKIRQFVAVDMETNFDNKQRMEFELNAEMKRINRYGGEFTLILLQIDHFDSFRKLYGEKEKVHLLSSLSKVLGETMRATDRKFRYGYDRFALLLTNTPDDSIEVIFNKLSSNLKTHRLLNENYITLSYRLGHSLYNQSSAFESVEDFIEKVESEMLSHEL